MGWTNDSVTELIAPNNVPFLPGNNVTGFGSTIPSELSTAGFANAIVFYATDWNPANVIPTVKFRFIAANGSSGLVIGYGLVNNPSVSQTATVVLSETIQNPSSTSGVSFKNSAGNEVYLLATSGTNAYMAIKDSAGTVRLDVFASGTPGSSTAQLQLYDNAARGRILAQVPDSATTLATHALYDTLSNVRGGFVLNNTLSNTHVGAATLFQTYTNSYIQTDTALVKDAAWGSISGALVNGWTQDATRVAQARLNSDDTVQLRGVITKVANPVNGEQWLNAFSSTYRPTTTRQFLTPTPGRTYNGQSVEVHNDGICVIFDMAAASGVICLDGIRYAAGNIP